jgi:carbamoyl-phosphate synthase large subunit
MKPEDAADKANKLGYPILLRPSFVLGGRGMFIV